MLWPEVWLPSALRERAAVSQLSGAAGRGGEGTSPEASPVMLLVHQVVPGPEGDQVSIVGWRGDRHGARAAHVGVTQLVGEDLQLVGREAIVVPQDVVVGRPACPLEAGQSAVSCEDHLSGKKGPPEECY